MPDLRFDPVNRLWVAIAENRSKRPNEFSVVDQDKPLGTCPFCGGHEKETPPELSAIHYSDLPKKFLSFIQDGSDRQLSQLTDSTANSHSYSPWLTRTVPNRYPAFGPTMDSGSPAKTSNQSDRSVAGESNESLPVKEDQFPFGPYRTRKGMNSRQYLIIESPRHVSGYSELNDCEVISAFLCYQKTFQKLNNSGQFEHVMLFKNCRPAAGASLAHVHTQVVALDFTTQAIAQRTKNLLSNVEQEKQLLQQVVDFEKTDGSRIIQETKNWIVFCPFASRFPFQTWILPKTDQRPLWEIDPKTLIELGFLVRQTIKAFDKATHCAAYNVLFHQPPFKKEEKQAQWLGHSFTEIFARSNGPAGFEWGTNCWINPVSPEHAAKMLIECW